MLYCKIYLFTELGKKDSWSWRALIIIILSFERQNLFFSCKYWAKAISGQHIGLSCSNFGSVYRMQPGAYGFASPFQFPLWYQLEVEWLHILQDQKSHSARRGKVAPATFCSPDPHLKSSLIACSKELFLAAEYIMLDLNFRWLQGGHEINTKCICMPLYLQ